MIILLSVDDEDDNDKENGWKDYLNVDGNDMNLWVFSKDGNLFKIIFRASAERVQALPINLQFIY